jgi:hypothetical protein
MENFAPNSTGAPAFPSHDQANMRLADAHDSSIDPMGRRFIHHLLLTKKLRNNQQVPVLFSAQLRKRCFAA